MHVLPRVRQLHERFGDTLEVIGIHAGKFATERKTDRIAMACDRLGVHHPVMNDRQFRVWRDYGVTAWPTVALIDPEGHLVGVQPGEFSVEQLARTIEGVIEKAVERGTLSPRPRPTAPSRETGGASALRFPTRAIVVGDRLWVSDTGHGRILECEWSASENAATVLAEHARFVEPRGLAPLGDRVYVADRGAHSIWALSKGERERVAGTGEIAEWRSGAGPAEKTALRSPWGLAPHGEGLAVAMAGSHQMWELDLGSRRIVPSAGTGSENLLDGPRERALLAQPTGVAAFGQGLAFADCESSAVRLFDDAAEQVSTLVGTGLFDFGDRSGVGDQALLQHCEDVTGHRGLLAVADTYNDRIKMVDPGTRECVPWIGDAGEAGAFLEPGGISSDGAALLVADTGNHRLVRVSGEGSLTEVRIA